MDFLNSGKNNTARHRVGLLGGPAGQGLDLVIFLSPFQFRIFWDNFCKSQNLEMILNSDVFDHC